MNSQPQNTYPPYLPPNEESIDIKRYISLFLSNWYWFAAALFISVSIAYGINRWSEKVYTISSTLLIKDDQNGALTEIFPGSEGFRSLQKVNDEIGILKSYNLNFRVIQKLPEFSIVYSSVGKRGIAGSKMYKTSPFIVIFDSLEKQARGRKVNIKILSENSYRIEINGDLDYEKELTFGERFSEAGFDFRIVPRSKNFQFDPNVSNKYVFYFTDPKSIANIYRSKLSVTPVEKEASLVTLTTYGYVPQQEADYLNTLMDVYLEFGLEYKNQTAAQTLEFIENQLVTISDSLEIAEKNLESFRLMNNLIDISSEGSAIQQKLEEVDDEKTSLIMQKNYYQYLKGYIDSKSESADLITPSVMGINDQLLIRLVGELSEFQKQKRQLSINLYESAEPLKIIEANIINARSSINENVNDGLRNIEKLIADVDRRLENIESDIRQLPTTERQMINIQRKFDINNTVYTFLLEKRAEAGIAKASNVPDSRIIDRAGFFSSARIKPKESRNLMNAVILGLIAPLVLILIIDYMNDKIIDRKDIEKVTSVPVIGYINHNNLDTEMPVVETPWSTLSESFRSVRTNIKYFLKGNEHPVISVCSTVTSEGKTFVSVNLAAILAIAGKRTLLIGLDLRKPRIHKIFGGNNQNGLSNFLIGEGKFDDFIFRTELENLWYAPSGMVPPNPAELIESDLMVDFIDNAKKKFEFIIIDTPPLAIVTDAILVSPFTDFYLFVVRQRYSSKNTLELFEELRKNKRINNSGIVINDISISGYYGYGLRYGYKMGYGYNYGYNYYQEGRFGYSSSVRRYL